MAHTCTDCGVSSDAARFYASSKRRCAECVKARVKANREKNAEHYRAFEGMRYARDYEKRRALAEAYVKTEAGREARRRSQAAYIARNPEKRAAWVAAGNAIRGGKIARPTSCQACGALRGLHGHHDDYSKPLDVRWLCVPCHEAVHHGERAVVKARSVAAGRANV